MMWGQKPSIKFSGMKLAQPMGYVGPPFTADTQGSQQFKRQSTTQAVLLLKV